MLLIFQVFFFYRLSQVNASSFESMVQLSADPYTTSEAEHKTQVEPFSFSYESTIVSAFQVGRRKDAGAVNIGWATSKDGGRNWKHGFLDQTTTTTGGIFVMVTDPYVAYDLKHDVWMISMFAVGSDSLGAQIRRLLISRSLDGGHTWDKPVAVPGENLDGSSVVCDNAITSKNYGSCYAFGNWGKAIARSIDGGVSWTPLSKIKSVSGLAFPGIFQDGTLYLGSTEISYSLNAGEKWNKPFKYTGERKRKELHLRTGGGVSLVNNRSGILFSVFNDCRFQSGCLSNDLVFTRTTKEKKWLPPVPINLQHGRDTTKGPVDYFSVALAVDPLTDGESTHLAIVYYFIGATCLIKDCEISVGMAFSRDAGRTWTSGTKIAGPMNISWLASSNPIGDYIGISYSESVAFPFFPLATPPLNGKLNESIFTLNREFAKSLNP